MCDARGSCGGKSKGSQVARWALLLTVLLGLLVAGALSRSASAQENPLGQVTTDPAPPKPKTPEEKKPVVDGSGTNAAELATSRRNSRIRVDVNMVLVPMTVTDPMNRLVTGLERENFQVIENNTVQEVKSFSVEDAPVSIGIIFDLSGSMNSKFARARKALSEFLRTSNPQDEYFVVGFNDRPAVIVDFTSDVEDVEARMVMLRPANRTALIDAIYLGANKLRQAKYDRKALLIISDGGDNRSRYTEGGATTGGEGERYAALLDRHLRPVRADAGGAAGTAAADGYLRDDGWADVPGIGCGGHGRYCDANQCGAAKPIRHRVPAEQHQT